MKAQEGEITLELFNHLVGLAALELDEGEAEYLRRELNRQLKSVHELDAISIDESTQITSHGVPYTEEISPDKRGDEWAKETDPPTKPCFDSQKRQGS